MAFLEVRNLSHIFAQGTGDVRAAVKDISFSLNEGEILGIIGHTGSGKSTLVTHLNGLIKPTSGEIFIEGFDIWDKPKEIRKIRSQVGLVFQYPEYQLFEETVYKDIAFGPANMGLSGEELDATVKNAAKLMQIDDELLNKSPFDLSGGQKRRVAIAGILAMRPKVIVFDEPTAGLDPIGKETIFKAICDYRDENNAVVIIVSHSMEEIAAVAVEGTDRVVQILMTDHLYTVCMAPIGHLTEENLCHALGADITIVQNGLLVGFCGNHDR